MQIDPQLCLTFLLNLHGIHVILCHSIFYVHYMCTRPSHGLVHQLIHLELHRPRPFIPNMILLAIVTLTLHQFYPIDPWRDCNYRTTREMIGWRYET
jgi:hypothetical protein